MRRISSAVALALLSACITVDLRTPAPSRAAAAPELRAPPAPPPPAAASFSYQGAHPAPAGGWCDLVVLHTHDFAPIAELSWTSPSPGVFVYMGQLPAVPPAPPAPAMAPAAVVVPVGVERTVEAIETVGAAVETVEHVAEDVAKAAKVVGKVGKAVGKGTLKFIKSNKNLDGSNSGSSTGRHHSSGHHGGHHGGGHH